ncbi:MAG: hypothetical protein KW806_00220 [Candidatus Yanofskybacteria bacterium]|nr:hypothetical protein [Candidatus Yanofskybacteria bacterium]
MNPTFSRMWRAWKRFGIAFGNVMSVIILTLFYFTVFALFAIPFQLLTRVLDKKSHNSNFSIPEHQITSLEDFQKEF